jgi:hypothetical protein
MSKSPASTPATASRSSHASLRVRRFAVRATVSASVLAVTLVSLGGMAWAAPELGC